MIEQIKKIKLDTLNLISEDPAKVVYNFPDLDNRLVLHKDIFTINGKRDISVPALGEFRALQNDYIQRFLERHGIATSYKGRAGYGRSFYDDVELIEPKTLEPRTLEPQTTGTTCKARRIYSPQYPDSDVERCRTIIGKSLELINSAFKLASGISDYKAELEGVKIKYGYVNITGDGALKNIVIADSLTIDNLSLILTDSEGRNEKFGHILSDLIKGGARDKEIKRTASRVYGEAAEIFSHLDKINLKVNV